MSTNRKFTEEEMKILRENPNIVSVSLTKLTYSLVFKQKAVAKSEKKGMTVVRIFALAGLTLELLGKPRITAAMKSFKKEAAYPEGLREPHAKLRHSSRRVFAYAPI